MTEQSSGFDLYADVDELIVQPKDVALISTGISLEIPQGYEAQVRPRSGLAVKHKIGVLNSPGTIDADYRGEVKVILFNFGNESFVVTRNMRIAQMVFAKSRACGIRGKHFFRRDRTKRWRIWSHRIIKKCRKPHWMTCNMKTFACARINEVTEAQKIR